MGSFWHPFAPMQIVGSAPFVVDHGEGIYVFDESGHRYLDATASLWYSNLGYGRREIADAVGAQQGKLHAYHAFGDFVTRPALALADRLAGVAPVPDSKVFFGSGGSDAVDTAAKLARRYAHEMGQSRRSILIAREFAYHGMHTYGTALGGLEPNRLGYGELVSDIVFVPYDDAEAVAKVIDHHGPERIAGMFVEAVIGAGGVRPVPVDYLRRVRQIIEEAGALYIADEVITGFGRCGDWFAASRFDLRPDIITFAKGVTAGYQPLGGIIASPKVAAPFFATPGLVWRHGYTYSGHSTACVAGLVVMDLYEREGLFARALELETELLDAIRPLTDLSVVASVRGGVGAMAAIQLDDSDPTLGGRAVVACRSAGIMTRIMVGGGLQISPPLTITSSQVAEMSDGFRRGLDSL